MSNLCRLIWYALIGMFQTRAALALYLLFEQLEDGNLKLVTPLPISAWAAMQNPTKLGLKANQTITVEDAINIRGLPPNPRTTPRSLSLKLSAAAKRNSPSL